jgi:hypothetical protein
VFAVAGWDGLLTIYEIGPTSLKFLARECLPESILTMAVCRPSLLLGLANGQVFLFQPGQGLSAVYGLGCPVTFLGAWEDRLVLASLAGRVDFCQGKDMACTARIEPGRVLLGHLAAGVVALGCKGRVVVLARAAGQGSKEVRNVLHEMNQITSLQLSDKADKLAVGGIDGEVKIYQLTLLPQLNAFPRHSIELSPGPGRKLSSAHCLRFDPQGNLIIAGSGP